MAVHRFGKCAPACQKLTPMLPFHDGGVDIASFDVPFDVATAQGTAQGTVVSRQFSQAQLIIPAGGEDAFSSFIASLITQPVYKFTIKGYSDATLSTAPNLPATPHPTPFGAFGNFAKMALIPKSFDVRGVGFSGGVTFNGGNSFPSIKYERQTSFTFDSTTGTCTLIFEATINNPSQLILKLGSVSLNTIDNAGIITGVTVIKDLSLVRDDNKVVMTTTSSNKEVCNKLLQTGDTFTLSGFAGTSSNPILNKALLTFKTQVVIPKLQPVASPA
ncbi:hypothetical protein BGX28_010265 [Mortierella sp. GBA30]|nr:hypothetical protein BGX28_010265 [Mortierella sp. GBA30]